MSTDGEAAVSCVGELIPDVGASTIMARADSSHDHQSAPIDSGATTFIQLVKDQACSEVVSEPDADVSISATANGSDCLAAHEPNVVEHAQRPNEKGEFADYAPAALADAEQPHEAVAEAEQESVSAAGIEPVLAANNAAGEKEESITVGGEPAFQLVVTAPDAAGAEEVPSNVLVVAAPTSKPDTASSADGEVEPDAHHEMEPEPEPEATAAEPFAPALAEPEVQAAKPLPQEAFCNGLAAHELASHDETAPAAAVELPVSRELAVQVASPFSKADDTLAHACQDSEPATPDATSTAAAGSPAPAFEQALSAQPSASSAATAVLQPSYNSSPANGVFPNGSAAGIAHSSEWEIEEYCDGDYVTAFDSFGGVELSEALRPSKSALELAREQALAANAPRVLPRSLIAEYAGPDLKESLVIRKWELERARDEALACNEPRLSARGTLSARSVSGYEAQDLDDVLRIHKLGIEVAKEAALAAPEPRRSARSTISQQDDEQGSLSDVLLVHKLGIEAAKEAALAGPVQPRIPARSPIKATVAATEATAGGGLDSLKPHKSRLERDKEAAIASNVPRMPARSPIKATQAATAAQAGGGLGEVLRVHKSKLELEKEAATRAAAEGRPTMVGLHADGRVPPRKSRLQLEKEAYARAMARASKSGKQSLPPNDVRRVANNMGLEGPVPSAQPSAGVV